MKSLYRRRADKLIRRGQPFADEVLVAVANFTWVGTSMGAQPGRRGRGDWAGGLPDWTLIGAGASRLYVIAADPMRPDCGVGLIGSWLLSAVRLTEERHPRRVGLVRLGSWRAVRFEFPDRDTAVLQPFGREVDAVLAAHRAAAVAAGDEWENLIEVALLTTSGGPIDDDVFFVLRFRDGTDTVIPLGDEALLTRLQRLPGFDNEAFIQAMGVAEEGVSVLWRAGATDPPPLD